MSEVGVEEKASGSTPAVFISYASQDVAVANAVVEALERRGVKCWIAPRDVVPGEFYAGAIVHAIDAAKVIVLILSENAGTSQHVLREVERASSKRHPVVAFRIDLAPMPVELGYFLNTSHWLDASAVGVEPALPKLADAVQRAVAAAAVAASGETGVTAKPVTNLTITTPKSGRVNRPALVLSVLIALGLGYFTADKLWFSKRTAGEQPVAAVAPAATPVPLAVSEKSVAVLPFLDMSEKKDQEYFADGLSEELIDMLTKVPELRVTARTSSFYFKGKQATIADIAKALSVANVLEGSVRKSGNHLRITAQLIRADNGYHIWSETYDRQLNDIFKVQDDIAGSVVTALKLSLLGESMPKATNAENTEAYTRYLQARALVARDSRPEIEQAAVYLRQALDLDPKFAPAWALYAKTRTILYQRGGIPFQQARAEANDAAMRAIALDPELCAAHVSMARVHWFDWNWAAMDAEIKRARQLDPNDSDALRYAGLIALIQGRTGEAIEVLQQAVSRNPLYASNHETLGMAYLAAGRLQESRLASQQAAALSPGSGGHFTGALALLIGGEPAAALTESELSPSEGARLLGRALALPALGQQAAADAALADFKNRFADDDAFAMAMIYAYRGETDQSFTWLERAYEQKDLNLPFIKSEPVARKQLKGDPRYDALLRKMKLLD
jgi:TolB-like protein